MTERDQARAAQTKVGRGDWIPRPRRFSPMLRGP